MARARSLSQFQKAFSDEASCVAFLFKRRWPDGFVCPVCGKRRVAALKSRPRLFECLDCGRQTSITAGTAMHRSRLPLTAWFDNAMVKAIVGAFRLGKMLENSTHATIAETAAAEKINCGSSSSCSAALVLCVL
jgi:transcription elongation factor Elf1